MNCLVLGGSGFIGRHLCSALVFAGHRVCAVSRSFCDHGVDAVVDLPGLCWQIADLCIPDMIVPLLEDVDIIFHLISGSLPRNSNENPLLDLQSNVVATVHLLDNMVKQTVVPKIVFLSSGGTVYGIPHTIPISEHHATDPICAYGIGKLAIEKYLNLYRLIHGLDYVVLRLANPYGSGQQNHAEQGVISTFLGKTLRGEPLEIWGDGSVVRDYVHIDDAIAAIMAAANYQGDKKIFNIGSGVGYSLKEIVAILEDLIPHQVVCRYLPGRPCDTPVNILDINQARSELCWQPNIDINEGISLLYSAMRARPTMRGKPE